MTHPLAILILVLGLTAQAQPMPPQDNSVAWMLNFWPAPLPVTNITFKLPTDYTIQKSADLATWTDTTIPATVVFTVANNEPQAFFRIVWKPTLTFQAKAGATGYRFYYGPAPHAYAHVKDLGAQNTFRLELPYLPTYCAVTVTDKDGGESDFSAESMLKL